MNMCDKFFLRHVPIIIYISSIILIDIESSTMKVILLSHLHIYQAIRINLLSYTHVYIGEIFSCLHNVYSRVEYIIVYYFECYVR